jgi:hypothetical protein
MFQDLRADFPDSPPQPSAMLHYGSLPPPPSDFPS